MSGIWGWRVFILCNIIYLVGKQTNSSHSMQLSFENRYHNISRENFVLFRESLWKSHTTFLSDTPGSMPSWRCFLVPFRLNSNNRGWAHWSPWRVYSYRLPRRRGDLSSSLADQILAPFRLITVLHLHGQADGTRIALYSSAGSIEWYYFLSNDPIVQGGGMRLEMSQQLISLAEIRRSRGFQADRHMVSVRCEQGRWK